MHIVQEIEVDKWLQGKNNTFAYSFKQILQWWSTLILLEKLRPNILYPISFSLFKTPYETTIKNWIQLLDINLTLVIKLEVWWLFKDSSKET